MEGRIVVDVTEHPIELGKAGEIVGASSGALVTFTGVVRDETGGRSVDRLEYEAYPTMALDQMRKIAQDAIDKWDVSRIALIHRTGKLGVGETSVLVAVAAPHRADAFEAARFCIDTLKQDVAIWKRELFSDGEGRWVEHA